MIGPKVHTKFYNEVFSYLQDKMNCSTLKHFFPDIMCKLYNFTDMLCDVIFSNFVVMKESLPSKHYGPKVYKY